MTEKLHASKNLFPRDEDGPVEKVLDLPARSPASQSLVRRAGASAKAGRNLSEIEFKRSKSIQKWRFYGQQK